MKIQVTFVSNEIEGNEIGEIRDEKLSDNFMKLLTQFLGETSFIYGKEVGSWEVQEDRIRLCVEEEKAEGPVGNITCYTCEVEAELMINLTVVDQQILDGDDWSTKLLKSLIRQCRKKKGNA